MSWLNDRLDMTLTLLTGPKISTQTNKRCLGLEKCGVFIFIIFREQIQSNRVCYFLSVSISSVFPMIPYLEYFAV